MWLGALLLTLYVATFIVPATAGFIRHLYMYHTTTDLWILVPLALSVLLVGWCDLALFANAWKSRQAARAPEPFPAAGDWLVLVLTISVNALVLPMGVGSLAAYLRHGGAGLLAAPFYALIIVLFDAALVMSMIKMRQEQRPPKPGDRSSS